MKKILSVKVTASLGDNESVISVCVIIVLEDGDIIRHEITDRSDVEKINNELAKKLAYTAFGD